MARFVDMAVSAVLLAGLYATMAYGLGLIYGVLAMSIDILAGFAGRTSLAHGAIFGVSAYVVVYAISHTGLHPALGGTRSGRVVARVDARLLGEERRALLLRAGRRALRVRVAGVPAGDAGEAAGWRKAMVNGH